MGSDTDCHTEKIKVKMRNGFEGKTVPGLAEAEISKKTKT